MFPMQHMREETDADDELMRFKLDQSKLQQQVLVISLVAS